MENSLNKRDVFSGRLGFILACVGSAVGMGNLWRFPILVSGYGGLTFLVPYFIFVVLIGATGLVCEYATGRAGGSGPIGAFGALGAQRGHRRLGEVMGAVPTITSMGLAIGYTIIMGWILKYTVQAITGTLAGMGTDMAVIDNAFNNATYGAGHATWWVLAAAVIVFAVLALGVAGGIEKGNKVMMPILFVLMVGLAIYMATLPGAGEGYKYILSFNGAGLADIKVWIYAFGQAFFSLSVAGNASVIYGSYLNKDTDLTFSAGVIAVCDTLAALLAALVILPAMAAGGQSPDAGGPGLMFIYLVRVFNGMPGGRVISIIFYVSVLFAGLSSIISMFESVIALLQERFSMKRVPATALVVGAGAIVSMLSQGLVLTWMDIASIYLCPIGALLCGIMLFWAAKKEFVVEQVSMGRSKPIGAWFYPTGKYVYCTLALAALILGAMLGGIG